MSGFGEMILNREIEIGRAQTRAQMFQDAWTRETGIGFKIGYQIGYQIGYKIGYNDGFKTGYEIGRIKTAECLSGLVTKMLQTNDQEYLPRMAEWSKDKKVLAELCQRFDVHFPF